MPSSENASLQLRQRQEQRISPKQLQAITVLQMPVTDLADYIQQAILENPLLEYEPAENRHLDGFAQDRSFYAANTSVSPSELAGRIDPAINGLSLFLSEQLARKKLPTPLLRCCVYLITLLDDRGYLQTEDINDAAELFDRQMLTAIPRPSRYCRKRPFRMSVPAIKTPLSTGIIGYGYCGTSPPPTRAAPVS